MCVGSVTRPYPPVGPGRESSQPFCTSGVTPFVSQVVTPLVQKGWLDSRPGPTGGYGLVTDPTHITILDVVELVEGPIDNGRCVLVGGPCAEAVCSVHDAWVEGRRALREAFAQVPIVLD